MKKQKMIFGLITILVSLVLMISGCTEQNSSSDQNNHPSDDSMQHLQEILAQADTNGSVYYELVLLTTVDGILTDNSTITVWQKKPYIKEEVSRDMITQDIYIKYPEGVYRYMASQGQYVLFPSVILPQPSTGDLARTILNNYTITKITEDTFDGKLATVIQYKTNQTGNTTTRKMWIWDEKGLPLKTLITTNKDNVLTTKEYLYKNYSFEEIPDSVFNITEE